MKTEISTILSNTCPGILKEHDRMLINILKICEEIKKNHNEWFINKDARFSVFGKLETTLNASKMNNLLLLEFIKQSNWWDVYNKKMILISDENALYLIRETDLHNRWSLFMGVYSIFEYGIKVIQLHFGNKNKVINYIVNDIGLHQYNKVLNFARWTRNSIHNNGIHIPDYCKYDSLNFNLFNKTFQFIKFHKIEFSWSDCFSTIEELILITKEVCLNTDTISDELIIKDIQ